jgi:uncharacterized protein YyaL (SSP411 family)
MIARMRRSVAGRLRSARAHPLLHFDALHELLQERSGGYAAEAAHAPHLAEALEWLSRAQDAVSGGGFARAYSLVRDPYFGWHGWQPAYPETTGYIVPTLLAASARLGRPDLAERARRAAQWEVEIQLASGAVRGGVVTQSPSPAVFNTGQVIFGWVAMARVSGDVSFADAAARAGSYLVSALGADGTWVAGRSAFARGGAELYNARTAWALAEAGELLGNAHFTAAATRALETVARRQTPNGWFPDCCLSDAQRPLLHTLAYTTRGLLEGARVLQRPDLLIAARRAAEATLHSVDDAGWMPGRYNSDWSPAVRWSCLTGQAQSAGIWMRLFHLTGETHWLEPVPRVLQFLKRTQNRTSSTPGVRGGIKGSAPLNGGYGRYEVLNWATKFYVDALLRHDRILKGMTPDDGISHLA